MKVIVISGKAGHGKDTLASFLKEVLEQEGKKVLIAHYGDLLKYICKAFFNWNGEKDEFGRTLLQNVGTDVIRKQRPDFWVDFIADMLTLFPDKWDYVLIPDARFPNEICTLKNHGFNVFHARIVRPGFSKLTEAQRQHISETALDNYEKDYIVNNDRGLNELMDSAKALANQLLKN
jgi:hypothetical protein